jgi:hypothetical protein
VKYFLDCLNPPPNATARTMFNNGWTGLCVYVGGPRCAAGHQGWPNAAVGKLAAVGFTFLPLYVGRNQPWDAPSAFTRSAGLHDGQEATVLTGACGFSELTILGLDMEYGTYQANPDGVRDYLAAWVEVVNGAGHPAVLYSDIDTLNHLGDPTLVDFLWGAAWVPKAFTTRAPVGRFDPSWPPPWACWQFGTGTIGGVAVDANSCTDAFPLASYQAP